MGRFPAGWINMMIVAIALLGSALSAFAQKSTDSRAKDRAAVGQAGKNYLAALERGDAKAIAEFWTAEGSYVDETGQTFKVRDLIDKRVATAKGPSRPHTKVSDASLRFIAADVAIEEGVCEIPSAGNSMPLTGRFTALWVRQNDKWKLDNLREWRTESLARDDRLASLEPLVGEWSGETAKLTMRVAARWNSAKTFLRRELSIVSDGRESFSGTQQIGWDPISQQIKSWVFNSDGSHGEGIWSLEGNVWMVLATSVLPDGKTVMATHVLKFKDKNTLIYKSMSANADGQLTPNFEIALTRHQAQK